MVRADSWALPGPFATPSADQQPRFASSPSERLTREAKGVRADPAPVQRFRSDGTRSEVVGLDVSGIEDRSVPQIPLPSTTQP